MIPTVPFMFWGEYSHHLDSKGRLIVPARYRPYFREGAVLTRGIDHNLVIYPDKTWQLVSEQLNQIPITNPIARALRRLLFSGAVQSACGGASAAMGPFYCPGDRKVYLDTDFFRVMAGKMGAGGDFAYAYVIAHEVGHHVQNLTGTLSEVNGLRARLGERDANRLSVATELQADCYAGIWARQASEQFGTIEEGDIDEAINAAAAVGDDTLMESAGRAVVPDAFTHGSAAERQAWFKRGFASGQMAQCDSFAALGN